MLSLRCGIDDFAAGRLIGNLPKLRHIGFAANRRVLEVETISHDNRVGAQAFNLRRLRLHGLIARIEKSRRHRVTRTGLAAVHFYHRLYTRLLRPAFSVVEGGPGPHPTPEERILQQLHSARDRFIRAQAA